VEAVVSERLTSLLEARLRGRDRLATERSRRFVSLARSLAENEDESAIITMLLDDYYQQTLHAPALKPGESAVAPYKQQPQQRSRPQGGRGNQHKRRR
jgi:ATP-dependent RNA helicase DeaD